MQLQFHSSTDADARREWEWEGEGEKWIKAQNRSRDRPSTSTSTSTCSTSTCSTVSTPTSTRTTATTTGSLRCHPLHRPHSASHSHTPHSPIIHLHSNNVVIPILLSPIQSCSYPSPITTSFSIHIHIIFLFPHSSVHSFLSALPPCTFPFTFIFPLSFPLPVRLCGRTDSVWQWPSN